jgi:prolipoprotein diacylglyceryltransferase
MPAALAVHSVLEALAYLCAVIAYLIVRRRQGDAILPRDRVTVFAGAAVGAAIGTRLLFYLCDPLHLTLFGGKTIVGGLLGGLIGVELAKKLAGIRRSTGDLLVLPIIIAISIGRLGCFFAGTADGTHGLPSDLPWTIDGRHPVALYEIAFVLLLIPITTRVRRRSPHEGDAFKVFLASYLAFRLAVDFLKPLPRPIAGGLTSIQWACLAGLAYYAAVFARRLTAERATA